MDELLIIDENSQPQELIITTDGIPGPQGPAGSGVPDGGTTGQLLRKASNADQDTEWGDPDAVASVPWGNITGNISDQTDLKGALTYRHIQAVPASVWTVTHNLGYRPGGISVQDSGGTDWEGMITHIDNNSLTITFSAAFSGDAYIS